jgi:membrane protease YdiL (CAAX protease family)
MQALSPAESRARVGLAIAAVASGMAAFALFSHQGMPWLLASAAGLAIAAAAILWSGFGGQRPAELLGLDAFRSQAAAWSLTGIAIGAGAGVAHRSAMSLELFPPAGLQGFVIVACLIGATEELVFRGWMLGRARAFGWIAAIVIAAAAHAAYKTALFAWPADPASINLARMAMGTFAGGLLLGAMRAASGSLLPALLAHAAFDFVVYRTLAAAPWWVWG